MAVKPILKMGNPVLNGRASDIEDPTTQEIRDLILDMQNSMKAAGGVGLAAPQIGVPLRIVIFDVPAERLQSEGEAEISSIEPTILINPVLAPQGDETALGWEGCLSVPGLRGLVPRHTHLVYSGVDPNGNTIRREAQGFHARVVQHECDHLDGILYPQRMTDLRYLVYEEEMDAFMAAFDDLPVKR